MLIERTAHEVTIRLPASVDTTGLQHLIDYLAYKEVKTTSQATQEQADALARQAQGGWWKENRKRFLL